jgi:hypothetical protein
MKVLSSREQALGSRQKRKRQAPEKALLTKGYGTEDHGKTKGRRGARRCTTWRLGQ